MPASCSFSCLKNKNLSQRCTPLRSRPIPQPPFTTDLLRRVFCTLSSLPLLPVTQNPPFWLSRNSTVLSPAFSAQCSSYLTCQHISQGWDAVLEALSCLGFKNTIVSVFLPSHWLLLLRLHCCSLPRLLTSTGWPERPHGSGLCLSSPHH